MGLDDEALVLAVLVDLLRLVEQGFVVIDLCRANIHMSEAHGAGVHSCCKRVSLVTAESHDVSGDHQLVTVLALSTGGRIERTAGRVVAIDGLLCARLRPRRVLVVPGSRFDEVIVLARRRTTDGGFLG